MTKRRVFAYVVRFDRRAPRLLVFKSQDEFGFEVPKGAVEGGERPEDAAVREVFEESGIDGARVLDELGQTQYENEVQHFILLQAPPGLADVFVHTVTGEGIDRGLRYPFCWKPIDSSLRRDLVQGCGAARGGQRLGSARWSGSAHAGFIRLVDRIASRIALEPRSCQPTRFVWGLVPC